MLITTLRLTQNGMNALRLAAWSDRYMQQFGVRPQGNISQHKKCCVIDDFRKTARRLVEL